MEGNPCSFQSGKSPVLSTGTRKGQRALPSYGRAPHIARGRVGCPGCTGSYSQLGCAPVGASPRVTSFQNRCGFWNGKKKGKNHSKTCDQLHAQPTTTNISFQLSPLAFPTSIKYIQPFLIFPSQIFLHLTGSQFLLSPSKQQCSKGHLGNLPAAESSKNFILPLQQRQHPVQS